MFQYIKMRFFHVIEFMNSNNFFSLWGEIIYFQRTCIQLEKDLKYFSPNNIYTQHTDLTIIKIDSTTFSEKKFIHKSKARYLKALQYLKKGYSGYGIVRKNEVIGDIWCFTCHKPPDIHPDLVLLNIKCTLNECYLFDMYISPQERGNKNVAAYFESIVLSDLSKKGYEKVYGYVWADNVPALWLHRIIKWKEKRKLKINRFLGFKKISKKANSFE